MLAFEVTCLTQTSRELSSSHAETHCQRARARSRILDKFTLMQELPDLFGPARKGGSSVLTPMDIELYGGMWPKSLPPRHVSDTCNSGGN
jgi:hypothetical protein